MQEQAADMESDMWMRMEMASVTIGMQMQDGDADTVEEMAVEEMAEEMAAEEVADGN